MDTEELTKGHRERLRERFAKNTNSAHDYELLELLLFNASARTDMKPMAKELMHKFKNFTNLFEANIDDLINIRGIGMSAAVLIRVLKEILVRMNKTKLDNKHVLKNLSLVVDYLRILIGHSKIEKLAILFVNTKYTLIDTEVIDHGTVDKIAIYIRELIKKAIEKNAYGIILSHNHPSQDITPSIPDITFTEELNYACNSMSIKLIDHIIIGSYAYYSFKENSVL